MLRARPEQGSVATKGGLRAPFADVNQARRAFRKRANVLRALGAKTLRSGLAGRTGLRKRRSRGAQIVLQARIQTLVKEALELFVTLPRLRCLQRLEIAEAVLGADRDR